MSVTPDLFYNVQILPLMPNNEKIVAQKPSSNYPVAVVSNRQGGVAELIENSKDPRWRFHIMLQQGDRYAHMLATEEYLAELNYEPGHIIEGGRILVKEQLEPFEPSDPFLYLKKKKDGTLCTKDGKSIYQKYYFTHNKKLQDIIVKEDN